MWKWTAGEKLLYTTGSPVWCSVMTLRGGKEEGERGSTGRGYKCNCGRFTLLYGRNQHNIVKIKKKNFKNQHILKKKKWLKQSRNTHLERKDVDILSNEMGHLFFHTYLTDPTILPKMPVQLFAKMDLTTEVCGNMSILTMEWRPLPFWPSRSLLTHVQKSFPWPQEYAPYLFTSAELSFFH